MVQLSTHSPTLSATMHSITNGQTDGRTTVSCQEPIIPRAVRSAKIDLCRQQINSNANNDNQRERDGYTDMLRVKNGFTPSTQRPLSPA